MKGFSIHFKFLKEIKRSYTGILSHYFSLPGTLIIYANNNYFSLCHSFKKCVTGHTKPDGFIKDLKKHLTLIDTKTQ